MSHKVFVTINGQTIQTEGEVVVRLYNKAFEKEPDDDVGVTFKYGATALVVERIENGEVIDQLILPYEGDPACNP